MINKAYERAFNIAIKYGFCGDCRLVLNKRHCHECDCYENTVKVIRDALEKLDSIEESKTTVWHDAKTDPPKDEGPYIYWYKYNDVYDYVEAGVIKDRFENIRYDYGKGYYQYGCWAGDVSNQYDAKVLAWTELPAPPTKEKINDDNNTDLA